ncbi:hypothetical protein [Geobacter pickeringii]|uniref:hypothetical protein n=1 Tax=Geobacter pickeringii TaxID=345632 RepID=UPI001185781C|nr:hypothetical protein [Geobacter pickeringii]
MKRTLSLALTCAVGLLTSSALAADAGTANYSVPPPSPSAPAQSNATVTDCRELLGAGTASRPGDGATAKPVSRMEIREKISAYRSCLQQQAASNSEAPAAGR